MANYTQYVPQTGSTTYPVSINDCFTALTTDVTSLENDKLDLAGGTMTGTLSLSGDPKFALNASTKQYTDDNFLAITGGTLTGALIIGSDTVAVKDAALTSGNIVSGDASGRITTISGITTSNIALLSSTSTFTAIPAFNGGTSGASAPFTVDSTFIVTNLNANLLDGALANTTDSANTIVKRTASNYIYATLYNTTDTVSTTNPTNVMVELNDGFIRRQSKANFISNLGLATLSGTQTFSGNKLFSGTIENTNSITDYVSGITEYIESDIGAEGLYNITLEMSSATWESWGPTGSGADNIKTGFDNIPTGAKWIDIKISNSISGSTTATTYAAAVYGRITGSSTAANDISMISRTKFENRSGASETSANITTARLPLDTSRRFDLYYFEQGTTPSTNLFLTIVGFGI